MKKKFKVLILVFVVIIAATFVSVWMHKKTKEASEQLRAQTEMQSKISEQQGQLDQQKAQIDELIRFNEDQQKEDEKTPEKPVINNQPTGNNKTSPGLTPDINKLKKQQECQKKINEYNECVNEQQAVYSVCLTERMGKKLPSCINTTDICSQPDC